MRRLMPVLAVVLLTGSVRADDDFEKRVRPLLVERCVGCHGPTKQSGGLRLDSRAATLKGGDTGPAMVPGDPGKSLLVAAVERSGELKMPPKDKLTAAEAAILAEWVKRGADWPDAEVKPAAADERAKWWAYQPVRDPAPPTVKDAAWAKTDLDRFVLAKLEAAGLSPSKPADKRTLLRRVTFDLTGLPPTMAEVEAFEKDTSAKAFEAVVERLLASPAYGERWGRHWLDVARYADTAGENADYPLPHAWRYRNWVIDSFNSDQPYDEFVREQVAGDILAAQGPPEKYAARTVATGFLAVARRFGHDTDTTMNLTYEDVIDTTTRAVLGQSVACARCHDHKYDPFTTRDYYALYGVFASTRFPLPGCEPKQRPRDLVPLTPPAAVIPSVTSRLADARPRTEPLKPAPKPVAYAVAEGAPADARIHLRGDPDKPGVVAPRRWLELFGGAPLPAGSGSGRLQLARWFTDPANPLTARVMVNRVWQHHFGKGLVSTPNDFGTRGQPPTHPELLDFLAAQFVKDGWSVKALHRRIVLSAAYRQASSGRADALDRDPGNSLLWRVDRRRLDAEEIRDGLLVAGGNLDRTPGGAHAFPPENNWNFTQHVPFSATYDTDKRSVYLMVARNRRHPFLGLFDGADPSASTAARQATTVPTQALYFMNDPFVHKQAELLAARVLAKADAARLDELYRTALQRLPTDKERERAATFRARYVSELASTPAVERAKALWAAQARVLLSGNEFLYVD